MFVFKAAVVGAGTMGGQIAQTIAAAGIPVVLKDVKQEFVDAGLTEARNVTQGQVGKLVEKGKLTEEQGDAEVEEIVGRIHGHDHLRGLRRRRLRDRGRARADGDQAGRVRRARRRDARPRDPRLEHVVAVDQRDRRGDAAPREGRRLPLLLPGVGHAADRDRRGRRDRARDGAGGGQLRPGDQEEPDHVRRGAGLRRQPHPQLGHLGDLARAGGEGPLDQEDRRGRRRRRTSCPSGPTSSSTCSAWTPCCTSPSTSTSPTATASTSPRGCRSSWPTASSAPRPAATASTRRRASPTSRATATRTSTSWSRCSRSRRSSRPASCSRRAWPPTATSTSG